MKNLQRAILAIVCISLAACGASAGGTHAGGIPALGTHAAVRPDPSGSTTVSTSDAGNNSVVICNPSCNDCKTVGGGLNAPMGNGAGPYHPPQMARAARRDYGLVADTMNSRVVVYTDTCSTVAVLNDSVYSSTTAVSYFPEGVAVAPDGTVAVTNACAAPSCTGPGNIAFFAPGSTAITSIARGLMSTYFFGDFDKHGNFYNDGLTSTGATMVGVVKRGSKTDVATGISGVGYPGGIQVARNGTINIDDQQCSCIRVYKGTKQIRTVTLSGTADAVTFAFNKNNSDIWVADKSSATVYEFAYPAGGSSINSIGGFSEPIGVAVSPPDRP
ncbi:MAG TPA: hypothetical protein VEW74_07980 [Candidatus Nitrosotalea sp.]|nr:hypothetical protein [Candidatus Nitrosotalea sp.]